jgi:hypothetical protein
MSAAGKNYARLAIQGPHLVLLLAIALGACTTNPVLPATTSPDAGGPDVLASAAAQATAIIQQAQATALVLQARAQATVVVAEAALVEDHPEVKSEIKTPEITQSTPAPGEASTPTEEAAGVEIIQVGYAADGGFILVSYKAEPDVADTFWPGQLSVTDEDSGTVYNEVPVMPKIGPMISRPVTLGQVGYIMFVNPPPGLRPGSLVTVILGSYTFKHLEIQ